MPEGNGQPRNYDTSNPLEVPAGSVNTDTLAQEIVNDPALAGATFDRIDTEATIVSIYFTADLTAPEIAALDTLVFNHQGLQTFSSFQYWEDNPQQSTTSDTYIDAMLRNAKPVKGGTVIVTWAIELAITAAGGFNSVAQARFRFNGNNKALHAWYHEEFNMFTGWDRVRLDEGETPELIIQVRRNGGNDTIDYRRMKIGLASPQEQDADS